jgi:serine/threonine protein kinase
MSGSHWNRLLSAWRLRKVTLVKPDLEEESFVNKRNGRNALASTLSMIESDRKLWEGTQRIECSEDDFGDRYFLREVIGSGTYGVVHRAIRTADAKGLAVKVIELGETQTERGDAIKECVLWQQLSSPYHPSVLPLIEIIEIEGSNSLHLVTEHMQYGDLRKAMVCFEDGLMSEQSIRLIMIQIASATAHLHCVHSVAHRDIKPENILCEGPDPTMVGCLKLCDFGCCRRFESLSDPAFDDPIGSASYFAPELASAYVADGPVLYAGAPADVWAIGAIAYELIHGAPPYYSANQTKEDMMQRMARDHLLESKEPVAYPETSFSEISAAGNQFVRQLLTCAPKERASVEEALSLPWLQPMTDPAQRTRMAESGSPDVAARRARATQQFRAAGKKVMLGAWLMRMQRRAPSSASDSELQIESVTSLATSFSKGRLSSKRAAQSGPGSGSSGDLDTFRKQTLPFRLRANSFNRGSRRAHAAMDRQAARAVRRSGEKIETTPRNANTEAFDITDVDDSSIDSMPTMIQEGQTTAPVEIDLAKMDPMTHYIEALSPSRHPQQRGSGSGSMSVLGAAFQEKEASSTP